MITEKATMFLNQRGNQRLIKPSLFITLRISRTINHTNIANTNGMISPLPMMSINTKAVADTKKYAMFLRLNNDSNIEL